VSIAVVAGSGTGEGVPVGPEVGDNLTVTELVGTFVGTEAGGLSGISVPGDEPSVAVCPPVEAQALAVKATNENNSKVLNSVPLLARFPTGILNGHLAIGSSLAEWLSSAVRWSGCWAASGNQPIP
jgi:hypothetical protein